MEDGDSRYPRKSYPLNFSNPRKIRTRDIPFARPIALRYDEEMDERDEEMDREFDDGDVDADFERRPKKRNMKNLIPSYEFAPRAKPLYGGRNLGFEEDWTKRSVFVVLEVWGERFVQLGRRSLRSEDWQEVAEKVTEISKIPRTEMQCRNMLDNLKRKYKKEKMRMEQLGLKSSKWAYFKKIDILMDSPGRQDYSYGLACGVDSGEFVFTNTRVYLDRSNRLDEMRDSPVESENSDEENENGNDSIELPPRRARGGGSSRGSSSSFRMLADSVQKFEEIYGKIESNKRQQMMELENMRKDFCRELELQKKQIMERTQAEIAKIQEEDDEDEDDGGGDEDTGDSAEDLSE